MIALAEPEGDEHGPSGDLDGPSHDDPEEGLVTGKEQSLPTTEKGARNHHDAEHRGTLACVDGGRDEPKEIEWVEVGGARTALGRSRWPVASTIAQWRAST